MLEEQTLPRESQKNSISKSQLVLQLADLERALEDVEPKFGAKSTELKALYRNGFVPYGENFDYLMHTLERLVEQGEYISCSEHVVLFILYFVVTHARL